jgi:hypothetical protein
MIQARQIVDDLGSRESGDATQDKDQNVVPRPMPNQVGPEDGTEHQHLKRKPHA